MKFSMSGFFKMTPAKIIVYSFFLFIMLGALLLTLPIASKSGQPTNFVDALFTSTSAGCVTGLVVADTLTYWSIFGQLVILGLIQFGGIGIITLATFFLMMLGKKLKIRSMILAQEQTNYFTFSGVLKMVRTIILTTVSIEAVGAVLLSLAYVPIYGAAGIYKAVFQAISAFCNAGFDLIGNYKSLTAFNGNPIIIWTTGLLIVIGGLGFFVLQDIAAYRHTKKLYLHSKIVIIATICLVVGGALFFYVMESSNPLTMAPLSFGEKINAAFFHSITTRTAGFNSLPLNEMTNMSKVGTVLLMFIGGAPGSTAGGVKITTAAVLILAIVAQIKGSEDTIISNHKIPQQTIMKSMTIIFLATVAVITVTFLLMYFDYKNGFLNNLYETTSAFGTVGLSAIGSYNLSLPGKLLMTGMMFLGKVGPLSLAVALTLKSTGASKRLVYPEGKIVVG